MPQVGSSSPGYGLYPFGGYFGPNVPLLVAASVGASALTGEQLLDLDGVSRRAESVQWDVLDADLVVIGSVTPIYEQPATVTNNVNRTIKRSCEPVRLAGADAAAINPLSDRLRPSWVLATGDRYPLGVFLWADNSRLIGSGGDETSGSLNDQTMILDQAVERTVGYDAGTSVTSALDALAAEAGLPVVYVEPSNYRLGAPVVWPVGTTRLAIMAELCGMIGYYSPYFDNWGTFVCRSVPDLTVTNAEHVYEAGLTSRIYDGSIVESDDTLEAPNRYIVRGSGANDIPVSAFYDIPADAPHSIQNRGRIIADVYEPQGVETSEQALAAAIARYVQESHTYRWIEFDSPPDPRHDTFGIVQFLGDLYREQEWRLTLAPGASMAHSLRRIYT